MQLAEVGEGDRLSEDGPDGEEVGALGGRGDDEDLCAAVELVDGHGSQAAGRALHAQGGRALRVHDAAARALRRARRTRARHQRTGDSQQQPPDPQSETNELTLALMHGDLIAC